jgi:hypothetical protein
MPPINANGTFNRISSALLVLELASPGHRTACRKFDVALHAVLHLLHDAPHVPVVYEDSDRGHAPSQFPADVHAAAHHADVRHVLQRYARTVGRVDRELAQQVGIAAEILGEPHHNAEFPWAPLDTAR